LLLADRHNGHDRITWHSASRDADVSGHTGWKPVCHQQGWMNMERGHPCPQGVSRDARAPFMKEAYRRSSNLIFSYKSKKKFLESMNMELFTTENLFAFLTLLALEIVLGIDNVIFISILSSKLPEEQRAKGRQFGLGLAVVSRILLLLAIRWVQSLDSIILFTIFGNEISGKEVVLLVGGLFLIGKSTYEIHEKLEVEEHDKHRISKATTTLGAVIVQIILIDVVFSLDSVITAVGIANNLTVMIAAIVLAAIVMILFAGSVSSFVERHPTMKMLALAFLILIGSMLVIEGWNPEAAHELHLKNYAYFAMAFSFGVEILNMRIRPKAAEPVKLHNQPTLPEGDD
jgi:predicted tellurium resistance membrane protein TerC